MAWFWKVTEGLDGDGWIPEKFEEEVELSRLGSKKKINKTWVTGWLGMLSQRISFVQERR